MEYYSAKDFHTHKQQSIKTYSGKMASMKKNHNKEVSMCEFNQKCPTEGCKRILK